jgi:hypothetical protein
VTSRLVLLALLVLPAGAAAFACDPNHDEPAPGPKADGGVESPPSLDAEDAELVRVRCGTPAWKGIYADFFGRGADQPGSCTFAGSCHNGPGAAGTAVSGFECSDEATCCRTLITSGQVEPTDPNAGLLGVLRTAEPGNQGFMPLRPNDYRFSLEAAARIRAWIARGDFPGDADGPPTPTPTPAPGDAGSDASDAALD